MKPFYKQYKIAKNNALSFMKKGQLNAYLNALKTMHYYKNLMIVVQSN